MVESAKNWVLSVQQDDDDDEAEVMDELVSFLPPSAGKTNKSIDVSSKRRGTDVEDDPNSSSKS
jgi:hypothetical protein